MRIVLGTFLMLVAMIIVAPVTHTYAATTVTVDANTTYQTMDGFGASSALHAYAIASNHPEPYRSELFDLLFSETTGMGLSVIRGEMGSGNSGYMQAFTHEGIMGQQYGKMEDQVKFLLEAQKRNASLKVVYTPWTYPVWVAGRIANTEYI